MPELTKIQNNSEEVIGLPEVLHKVDFIFWEVEYGNSGMAQQHAKWFQKNYVEWLTDAPSHLWTHLLKLHV